MEKLIRSHASVSMCFSSDDAYWVGSQKEDNRPIVSMSRKTTVNSFNVKATIVSMSRKTTVTIVPIKRRQLPQSDSNRFGIRNSRESSLLWECKMRLRCRTSGIFRSGNIWQILEPLWIDMIVRRSSAGRILHFPALEATPDSKCSPGGQLGIYSGDKAELEKEPFRLG